MFCTGQPVTEVTVGKDTASEVARLFLQEREREGVLSDITEVSLSAGVAAGPLPLPPPPLTDCSDSLHPPSGEPLSQ